MSEQTNRATPVEDMPKISMQKVPAIGDTAACAEAQREKLTDDITPGYQAEFKPDEAERAGALPVFIEDVQHLDIPPYPTLFNTRMLFGRKPGESMDEVLARLENERRLG